jgi:hypothetical protein
MKRSFGEMKNSECSPQIPDVITVDWEVVKKSLKNGKTYPHLIPIKLDLNEIFKNEENEESKCVAIVPHHPKRKRKD